MTLSTTPLTIIQKYIKLCCCWFWGSVSAVFVAVVVFTVVPVVAVLAAIVVIVIA